VISIGVPPRTWGPWGIRIKTRTFRLGRVYPVNLLAARVGGGSNLGIHPVAKIRCKSPSTSGGVGTWKHPRLHGEDLVSELSPRSSYPEGICSSRQGLRIGRGTRGASKMQLLLRSGRIRSRRRTLLRWRRQHEGQLVPAGVS
jgi:hypothetical protein